MARKPFVNMPVTSDFSSKPGAMTISNRIEYKFLTLHGTFVDCPEFGTLRVRKNTFVGVSLDQSKSDTFGRIQFILENRLDDPVAVTLAYDSSLNTNEIQVIVSRDSVCSFFFPGFIDTHIHASQYPNNGIFGNNSTLLDWLNKYTFPTESALKNNEMAELVYSKVIDRTLSHGTTTACYYTTIDLASSMLMAALCSKAGQRALIGKVCMDSNSPDYYVEIKEESIQATKKLYNYLKEDLVDPKINIVVTPRFAPSCSRDLMSELGKFAKENNLHVQTHLSENEAEINWVKGLFPECSNYTDVYSKYDLLYEKTIFAHCLHLTNDEIELIKKGDAGISHCPISNTSLTSGECPIKKLYHTGIEKIGLGTDVSAGYSCSILESARSAHSVSRHLAMKMEPGEQTMLSVLECLHMATLGGASVIDMKSQLGSYEIGKFFDSQLIDLQSKDSRIDIFDWQIKMNDYPTDELDDLPAIFDYEDVISKWFFNGDDRNVVKVWVNGSTVVTNIK